MDSLFADVCHRNDDERLDELSLDQSLRGLIDSPLDAGKRSGGVENILSVVQIQHRITSRRETPITRRQIDENVAPVSQDPGLKSPMAFDIAGQRVFGHENEMLREDADFVQHPCSRERQKKSLTSILSLFKREAKPPAETPCSGVVADDFRLSPLFVEVGLD